MKRRDVNRSDRPSLLEYVLLHGELPANQQEYTGHTIEPWHLCYVSLAGPCRRYERFAELWSEHGEALTAEWTRTQPGTRPYGWWLIDAPRARHDGDVTPAPEPLRQVGGSGRPVVVGFDGSMLAKSRGIRPFEEVDPTNPPLIESEAAYLERHGRLLPGEGRRLTQEDFEPVEIVDDAEAVTQ